MIPSLTSTFSGVFTHPQTSRDYAYAVTWRMAVNLNGLEAVRICGQIQCGDGASDFALLAHADPGSSLGGRAASVVMDCVALACERDAGRQRQAAQPDGVLAAGAACRAA